MNYLDTSCLTRPPVTVIDSIMGSGKTTWIIDYMNGLVGREVFNPVPAVSPAAAPKRFIYVTPLLDETARIKNACPLLRFKNPVPRHGSKFYDFKLLLEAGENIATTHSLFSQLDRECYRLIKDKDYTLVIDEALNCLEVYDDLSEDDRSILFDKEMVYVEEDSNKLRWNYTKYPTYSGEFQHIKDLCGNGNLVVYGGRGNKVILIWEFAVDFLFSFKDVFILTYLYRGSPMSLYLMSEGFGVDMWSVQDKGLVPFDDVDEAQVKAKLRELITIYTGPKNRIGDRIGDKGSYPFSATWFDTALKNKNDKKLKATANIVYNFFKLDARTHSPQNGWTTIKKARGRLEGSGYSRGFIPCNAKATNKFAGKTSLAYVVNVYYQTIIKQFFTSKGMTVYEDLFALSEMLQWVFRSAIRNGEPITIFIPSPRMRDLFKAWLHTDNHIDLISEIDAARYEQMSLSKMRREGVEA